MPRRRVPQPPVVATEPLIVHPDWQLRVAGIAAAAVCDVRPATAADRRLARAVLYPPGRPDERGSDEDTLLLVAWADPAILATGSGPPPGLPDRTAGSRVRPVGCLGIRWSGPIDPDVRAAAGSSVELFGLAVARGVRRLGIGRTLLGAAEHRCLQAGSPRLVVRIAADASEPLGRRVRAAGFESLFAGAAGVRPSTAAGADAAGNGTWMLKDLPDPVGAAHSSRRRAPRSR